MNTYLAIISSVVSTFIMSSLYNKGRLQVDHVQNATLAGGVIIGAVADILIQPHLAIVLGFVGGITATLGFMFLPQLFNTRMKTHDTCGVHSLHAVPGNFVSRF